MFDLIKKIFLVFCTFRRPDVFILDFFKIASKNKIHQYRLSDQSQMFARSNTTDAREIAMVFSDFEYPRKYFPAKQKQIIFDLGANIGSFSIYIANALKFFKPIIYAFEPSLENYQLLQKNIKLNQYKNIKPYRYALSSKNGQGFLDTSLDCDAYYLDHNSKKGEKVNLITLPAFCKQHHIKTIDLLKIDIEGGEYDLIKHSLHFITKNVRYIFIEIHDLDKKRNRTNLLKLFTSSGFSIIDLKQTYFLINTNIQ